MQTRAAVKSEDKIMNWPVIVLVLFMVALIVFVFWKRHKKDQFQYWSGVPIPKKRPFKVTTPRGMTIESVIEVPSFVINWVDEAYDDLVRAVAAIKPDWHVQPYTVYMIDGQSLYSGSNTTLHGAPQFTVSDGRNCSAFTIGVGNDGYPSPVAVVPHQKTQSWQFVEYFRNSVHYEGEHITMWLNDRDMFYAHLNAADVHPIFPDPQPQLRFSSAAQLGSEYGCVIDASGAPDK